MRRAVIYARYSTDLQSDRSIDDQVALCRDFAEREGLSVTTTFADRAKSSASILGRDGLLDLMAQAQAGAFDVVVVEALDRLSRDQEDLAGIHKRLSFAGIDILSVHDGRADLVQVGIRGLLGTLFLQDLKHKVRRGMQGVVRDGRNAGGRCFGYAPVPGAPGQLVIVEAEAEIVREIYTRYAAGETPRSIAQALNARGALAPRGTRWNASTINGSRARGYGILHNPLYAGERIWNRVRMVRDPDSGKRVSRVNPESEWMREPAPDLEIVPAELVEKVRVRVDRRSKAHAEGKARKPGRIFSGLLKCACCGAGMAIHDRDGAAIRIRCSTARESGSCENGRTFRLDKIETEVFRQLADVLEHPAYLQAYLEEYRAERRRLADAATKGRRALERRVARTQAAYDRSIDLYINGVVDGEPAKDRIRAAEAELNDARSALEGADAPPPVIELHPQAPARFAEAARSLGRRLAVDPDHEDREAAQLLRQLIAEIIVTPEEKGCSIEIRGRLAAILADPKVDFVVIGGSGGGT